MQYDYNEIKNAIDEISKLTNSKNYPLAIEMCKKYPNSEDIQFFLLSIYKTINVENKLEKMEAICRRFPDSIPMKIKLTREYIDMHQFKKAVAIFEKYPNNPDIQAEYIRYFIKCREFAKAKELASKFPNSACVQFQNILAIMHEKDSKHVEEIAKRREFLNFPKVQIQYMNALEAQDRFDEAKEIGKRFPDYEPIQSNIMSLLRKEGNVLEAKKIAEKFPQSNAIYNQLMIILIKEDKIDKAKQIAFDHPEITQLQYQLCKIYLQEKNYEAIASIAKNDKFKRTPEIEKIYFISLIEQNRVKDAIKIADDFPDNSSIQFELYKLLNKQNRFDEAEKIFTKFANEQKFKDEKEGWVNMPEKIKNNQLEVNNVLYSIRMKIHDNTISMDDIKLLDSIHDNISDRVYKLSLAAIYERVNNPKRAVEILNSISERGNSINTIINNLKNKKAKFYDMAKWDTLIGWFSEGSINYEEVNKNVSSVNERKENANKEKLAVKAEPVAKKVDTPILPKNQKTVRKTFTITSAKTDIIDDNKEEKLAPKNSANISDAKVKKNKNNVLKYNENSIYSNMNDEFKSAIYEIKLDLYSKMKIDGEGTTMLTIYDYLERSLGADRNNDRAIDNILIILISEGYDSLVAKNYPEKYQTFNELIKQASS